MYKWERYLLNQNTVFTTERYAIMEKISTTIINNLIIEGVEGDYVFEVLKNQNTFYENHILEKWLPYIKDSKVILDIGANLGNHSLFWAKNTKYHEIYSFEPYAVNYERLVNNIANNAFKNVFPINYGVGAYKGYSSILNFSEDNYGATAFDTKISDSGDIEIIDIDSFAFEHELNQIDFVKIDTEGFEESVLSGMKQTIELCHPDIWIEVSEKSFHHVIDALLPKGYVMADVEGFNILFLASGRHEGIRSIDIMLVLAQNFNNLSRTNKYYQHYIRAKGWVNSRDTINENLNQCIAQQKQELSHSKQKIQEQEESILLSRKEKNVLEQQLQEAQKQQQEFVLELANLIGFQGSQNLILQHTSRVFQTQQEELRLLRKENEAYKQRWDKLSSKWYGRLALKVFYRRFSFK